MNPIDPKCMFKINGDSVCSIKPAVVIQPANPIAPKIWPQYYCFSHLTAFLKNAAGFNFLLTRLEKK